ncbi:MAG: DUF1501 domain-containing protein [Cyanobacteria bacterium]|nr:DUF1501 domain-containing protein [Cyanobacteriota bacterium]
MATSLWTPLGKIGAWALRDLHPPSPGISDTKSPHQLIVIFLRGAADGLNIVIPYGDGHYYDKRKTIAIPEPGKPLGALDLNGHFGLHPALSALHPFWHSKQLAFYHATGSPDPTRSHFDAQDYMESGTPGVKSTPDGWLNRMVACYGGTSHSPTQAINFGPTIPRILSGKQSVANLSTGRKSSQRVATDNPRIKTEFDKLYGGNDELSKTYREAQSAHQVLKNEIEDAEQKVANNGSPLANQFGATAQQLAQLLKKDKGVRVAFVGVGGWDTHVNQGNGTGQLARNLQQLGDGLGYLATSLGEQLNRTNILVMSEFGRTVAENGNGGTDHGHGNVMWLLGGGIAGGKLYGEWKGLTPNKLFEGRDVPVNTDFRTVIGGLLQSKFSFTDDLIRVIFPGMIHKTSELHPFWSPTQVPIQKT